jgi:hypothetical protein
LASGINEDTLIEHGGQGLYQPLDLPHCQVPRGDRAMSFDYERRQTGIAPEGWPPSTPALPATSFATKGVRTC